MQTFDVCEQLHVVGKASETRAIDLLHGDAFYEISGAESAASSRPSSRGQNVVAAACVVTERLGRERTDKYSACCIAFLEKRVAIVAGKTQVFGRKAIHKVTRLVC